MSLQRADRKQETLIAIVLLALTLLTRFPFRSQILFHWDSVNFAYAMREFNLAQEQPQPPGYILYVWLCRLVNLVFHDAQMTMVWISIVGSALAVVVLFYLGRSMLGRRVGVIAALFLCFSPLFWFYGEIALPHALDTLLVLMGVWFLYETMQGRHRYLYLAMVVLAISAGVRQQTLVFLAPLILFSLRKVGWKRFLLAGALGSVLCLLWFIPLMVLSGGIRSYFEVMGAFGERFQTTTSVLKGAGWWGIQRNVRKLAMYTVFGWGAALLPALAGSVLRVWRRDWPHDMEKLAFLALWVMPPVLYYAFIHMGQPGLVFVFLPALLLWGAHEVVQRFSANPLRWLALNPGKARWQTMLIVAGVLLAVNVGAFFAPEYPLGGERFRLWSRAALLNSDRYYQDRFVAIRQNSTTESTAILAVNWHHVEYYLPEYVLIPIDVVAKWELGEGEISVPSDGVKRVSASDLGLAPDANGTIQIVLFDTVLAPINKAESVTDTIPLQHGSEMQVLSLTAEQQLCYGQSLEICGP